MVASKIGEKIKTLREERNLSQSELGKIAKIHQHHISKFENAVVEPTANNLRKLSIALQVSIDYLLFDGEKKEDVEFLIPELKERILLISRMNKKDQEAIIRILDGMIIKNHINQIPETIAPH